MVRKRVFEKRGRDRLYIVAEILVVAKDGSLKTQIMYRANLSFAQLNEYLSFLLKIGLLKKLTKDGKTIFKITPKGIKYLENYEEISKLLVEPAELDQKQTLLIQGDDER